MSTTGQAWPGLRVGEADLRVMLDSIPARVALYDRDRRHRYVNREYANFVGREPEAILGRTLSEVMGPETYARLQPFYGQLQPHSERALAGEASRWEGWLPYSGHGEPCFVQRFYVPHRAAEGAVDGYFVFARDLTELKRSEALNAAVIASALDCVVVIDEAGDVIEFNPAAERTFGYSRGEALGRPIAELIVPPAMRARHADGFRRYLQTGQGTMLGRRVEVEAMRADGALFPVELAITEVRLADRRLFTAHLRDLTQARQAAAELQRQREALLQSEKMAAFGSLLAGVAHELNNPLAIVLGGALMLQEEAEEAAAPALAGHAERVRVAAERCARIVRSFLAMARQQAAERRPVAAAALVDGALQLLAYGLRSDGIEVAREVPADLPALFGDADQLHQVLANLVTNARQALEHRAEPRRLRIAARAVDDAVEVSVADNGPGIPAAVRGRIFDPFYTTKPVGAGTGIGLAVSRGIAEAHGGSLGLADAPEGGACFVLRLPRAGARADGTPAEAGSASAAAAPTGPRTALIVDDETELASVLAEMLAALRIRCDLAATGREAQRLLSGRDYDAILCDLRMPDMDGQAFFAWMAENRAHLCPRTAFVTGDALGPAANGFLARSGRPVLEKPFLPEEVRRLVAALSAS